MPLAAIPVFFGLQQFLEGGLWLGLSDRATNPHLLTIAYLLMANVLWPIYVPIAVAVIEPREGRWWKFAIPSILGLAAGLFFFAAILTHPVWAEIAGRHIRYHLPHPYHNFAFGAYFVATCIAPLLSSHRMIRLFGVVLIGSALTSRLIYAEWFASVWCYFAALASCIIFVQFKAAHRTAPLGMSG